MVERSIYRCSARTRGWQLNKGLGNYTCHRACVEIGVLNRTPACRSVLGGQVGAEGDQGPIGAPEIFGVGCTQLAGLYTGRGLSLLDCAGLSSVMPSQALC